MGTKQCSPLPVLPTVSPGFWERSPPTAPSLQPTTVLMGHCYSPVLFPLIFLRLISSFGRIDPFTTYIFITASILE